MNKPIATAAIAAILLFNILAPVGAKPTKMSAKMMAESAEMNEADGNYEAALKLYSRAIRKDRLSAVYFLAASRVRMKMGDKEMSAGNLYHAVKRARRSGSYSRLAAMARSGPKYSMIMGSEKNRLILDLYDKVEEGTLSEAKARKQISAYEIMRDAPSAIENPFSESDLASAAPAKAPFDSALEERQERNKVICNSPSCVRARLSSALARGDKDFADADYEGAAGNYELALTISELGSVLSTDQRAEIFMRVGVSLRRMGLVDESVKLLTVATKSLPDSASAHYEMAATYSLLEKHKQAASHLKKAFKNAMREGDGVRLLERLKADDDFELFRLSKLYEHTVEKYEKE